MTDPLETTFYYSGETMQHRKVLPISDIFRIEPFGSPIPPLYAHWVELRRTGRLPTDQEILRDIGASEIADRHISIVDVSDPSPAKFCVINWLFGDRAQGAEGMTQFSNDAAPCQFLDKALTGEYLAVRELGVPAYHDIEQVESGRTVIYRRLILPAVDGNGRVARLIVGVCLAHRRDAANLCPDTVIQSLRQSVA